MTVSRNERGQWYLQCSACPARSPHAPTSKLAREVGKALSWARSYPRGRGEDFYCQKDRQR